MKVDSRRATDLQTRDLGRGGASKTAAKRPLHPYQPLSTIPTPRAGFDRLRFSVPRNSIPCSLPKLPLPDSLGPFRRRKDNEPDSSPTYRRRAAYATADEGIFMEVLYQPRYDWRPLFQVQFRASMRCLLDLRVVEQAIDELPHSILLLLRLLDPDPIVRFLTPVRFTLSEVELTLDFPGGGDIERALRRSLLTPWCRQHYARNLDDASGGRGSRPSRIDFRLYEKVEDGMTVNRVEWVIHRNQLRRWRVNTITDLRGVPWTSRVLRRMRFVEFRSSRGYRHVPQWTYEGLVKAAGPAYTLRKLSPKARQWLRGRLRPNDLHAEAEGVLREFEATLSKGEG